MFYCQICWRVKRQGAPKKLAATERPEWRLVGWSTQNIVLIYIIVHGWWWILVVQPEHTSYISILYIYIRWTACWGSGSKKDEKMFACPLWPKMPLTDHLLQMSAAWWRGWWQNGMPLIWQMWVFTRTGYRGPRWPIWWQSLGPTWVHHGSTYHLSLNVV